jgi:hypothetical protein
MNGTFGVTYEQLQPKLSLSAGPSATKHGPNICQPEKKIKEGVGRTYLEEWIYAELYSVDLPW